MVKSSKIGQNGHKWSKAVNMFFFKRSLRSKTINMVQNGQNGQCGPKWSLRPNAVKKNNQITFKLLINKGHKWFLKNGQKLSKNNQKQLKKTIKNSQKLPQIV